MAYHTRDRHGMDIRLVFVDPDVVEDGNIGRQNFCPAEVGEYKAWSLMRRYNAAFGLRIEAHVAPMSSEVLDGGRVGELCLVVGCVDNGAGRREIRDVVSAQNGRWWLDCGNHEHAGQVVVGNRADLERPEISPLGFCSGLPLPSVVHPELLVDKKGIRDDTVSCAEMTQADVQSLMINQAVATFAAQYVYRMVLARDLDVYATYLDLVAGSARSLPIVAGGDGAARRGRRRGSSVICDGTVEGDHRGGRLDLQEARRAMAGWKQVS